MSDEKKPDDSKIVKTTRYLIYETFNNGQTLTLVSERMATSSDQAARLFMGTLPEATATTITAISENACKMRRRTVKKAVSVEVSEIGAPKLTVPESVEEEKIEESDHRSWAQSGTVDFPTEPVAALPGMPA